MGIELRLKVGRKHYGAGIFLFIAAVSAVCPPPLFGQVSLIDPSFSVGNGAVGVGVNSILLLNDGKILVGGEFTEISGSPQNNLACLTTNGELDATFNVDADGAVNQLLQQPDGKILVCGSFSNLQGEAHLRIGRLLTNGLVDPDFDAGTNFGDMDSIQSIAIQPDGKILAASYSTEFGVFSTLRRLNVNGQLDSTYTNSNFFNSYITALLARTNGTALVGGGFSFAGGVSSPALALLDQNGLVNASTSNLFQSGSDIFSLVEMTNADILVGGLLYPTATTNRTVLGQLTLALTWNTNFMADEFSADGFVRSVELQPDSKIVVGGYFYVAGGYWRRHIARLDASGHVDPCFDPGLGFGNSEYYPSYGVNTLARQPDGRILAGGKFFGLDGNQNTNITRMLPQSDCNMSRVRLTRIDDERFYVAGTSTPGASSYLLESSTNLVDWDDIQVQPFPYVYQEFYYSWSPATFFRIRQEYPP
jgi:uncharacterized delta-60 repeat protein